MRFAGPALLVLALLITLAGSVSTAPLSPSGTDAGNPEPPVPSESAKPAVGGIGGEDDAGLEEETSDWRARPGPDVEGEMGDEETVEITPLPLPSRPETPRKIPFETIDWWSWSFYLEEDYNFAGGCLVIRDGDTWAAFWAVHTEGISPQPHPPAIDFSRDMVLGCFVGVWTDCCATYAEILGVETTRDEYAVTVVRHYEHGMACAMTNPFHLVSVARTEGSVAFYDAETGEPIPDLPPVP